MLNRTLILVLKAVGYILYAPFWLIEEATGQGRWYRRQKRRMVEERPPLTDAEYLRALDASEEDAPICLAIRRCLSESIGVPAEAIRPEDRMVDLWRMQWIGPDLMDLIFRLERSLGRKIPMTAAREEMGRTRPEEFGPFAACIVRGLRTPPGTN
ncbi:acyl carrier protein [Aquisphaera insulae]|uniref:acyl carrier protein n=1 Tax=Aquisphaera insulae TaxID=2712864 RepID=UPI0013E9F36D|nr:hypothetical protein [Aquisphaera insulae]